MNEDEIIDRAIQQFYVEATGLPQPGNTIAHPSDDIAYELRGIENGVATGFYTDENGQEVVKQFPANEIFCPGAVQNIAIRLASELN